MKSNVSHARNRSNSRKAKSSARRALRKQEKKKELLRLNRVPIYAPVW